MARKIVPGFYQHFKHTNTGRVHNYRYEVVAIGPHTETQEMFVSYRPLYPNKHMKSVQVLNRPLSMFASQVHRDGRRRLRFKLIRNKKLIKDLQKVSLKMYPNLQCNHQTI